MIDKLVVVGSTTLAGSELIESILRGETRPNSTVFLDPGTEAAVIAARGDELAVSVPLTAEAMEGADVIVACTALGRDDAAALHAASRTACVIDVTGTLGGRALDARSPTPVIVPRTGLVASPAAASLLLAALLRSARAAGALSPGSAVVMEPASELGRDAVDELHAQAVAMLSFQDMPKAIFGVPAIHDVHSPGVSGLEREATFAREISELAGAPAPPLIVVRPGTFHGVAVTVHAPVPAARWLAAMAAEPRLRLVLKPTTTTRAVSPAGAVQGEQALVGRVFDDGQGGAWAWAAADTLVQGAVGNAFNLLTQLMELRH